jgi:pyruvate ferredoxin oxidoreductase beta subunit
MGKTVYKNKTLLYPGHTACSGCGQLLAARHVINTFGPNTIVADATGCLEVTTTKYGESAWGVPYIHSLFENPSAVASGILAAQKFLGKESNGANIVVFGGDGSTFDIGFGLIAGMFERGENITYVCFDNEGYQNTGGQFSGSTPLGSQTTTTPIGKRSFGSDLNKKDIVGFALSQGVPYVATASVAYLADLEAKIAKAKTITGPKYIQILVPCVPGWGIDSKDTIRVARLAVETGFYPILEYVDGKLVKQMKVKKPAPRIEEYLKLQNRFKHLFKETEGGAIIKKLQRICDDNIQKFGL